MKLGAASRSSTRFETPLTQCYVAMTGLSGRVAVVVGAGSGLGRDVACAVARRGAHVVLAGRKCANLDETLRILRSAAGSEALVAPTDVTEPRDVDRLREITEQRFG